jgi:hypothetical protein
MLAWIFFRSSNLINSLEYLTKLLSPSLIELPQFPNRHDALYALIYISILVTIEWINRREKHTLAKLPKVAMIRYIIYYLIFAAILNNTGTQQQFIYFQF